MPLFSKSKSKENEKSTLPATKPQLSGYPVQQSAAVAGGPPSCPPPSCPPPPYTPYQQSPPVVVVQGGFAAGARFNGASQPHIPPPPPGCPANVAQMAVMSGQSVVVTQQQSNLLEGTGSSGYTVW